MTAEEFGEIVLRANNDGSLVRLKDVARIALGAEDYTQRAYTNGEPAAAIVVYQAPRLERARHQRSSRRRRSRNSPSAFRKT